VRGRGLSVIDIRCGDCLTILPSIPDASVDAVITDPPYSSGGAFRGDRLMDNNSSAKYVKNKTKAVRRSFQGDTRDQRGYLAWLGVWLSMSLRATKPAGLVCVFTDWRQIATTIDAVQVGGWVYRGIVAWDKTQASLPLSGRFRAQCEYIVWGTKGPRPANKDLGCHPGLFKFRGVIDKQHIAEKPVELMEGLIKNTPEGGTILDPFAGRGSTGVACVRMDRDFIGIEIDPFYCDLSWKCIAAEQAKTALFTTG
jgi:site-specific DNA-methyltransferase (adenine-specific)